MALSDDAKKTVEWVREAFGADEVHPVDPNLVLSTDDTTVFVFEGAQNDGRIGIGIGIGIGKWEWKICDKSEPSSSVHSDFQVGEGVQMAGGLRVRLTFTFTASGVVAPPYVAVCGLTEEELSHCHRSFANTKYWRNQSLGYAREVMICSTKALDGWFSFVLTGRATKKTRTNRLLVLPTKSSAITTIRCYSRSFGRFVRSWDGGRTSQSQTI